MEKKKSVLILSPHSDDVVFSAFCYLSERDKYDKIVIFTVENDPKRIAEDKLLEDIFGIKVIHGTVLENDKSYYEFYETNKVFSYDEADSTMKKVYGKQHLKEIRRELENVCDKYSDKGYEIVTCLGLGHPAHWFVRRCTENYANLYYRDFPHSYKRKTQECYKETLLDFELKESIQLSPEEHEVKWTVAKSVYKSQSSLLWFEKGYIDKNLPEEYYVKK